MFNISVLLDVQANLPETSPFLVFPFISKITQYRYGNGRCQQLKGCVIVENNLPLCHSQLIGIFHLWHLNLSPNLSIIIDARICQKLTICKFFKHDSSYYVFHFIFKFISTFYEPFYSHVWSCFLLL